MRFLSFAIFLSFICWSTNASSIFNPHNRYMIMQYEDGTIRVEDLQRPIPREGIQVPESDINFYLYTQANKEEPLKISLADFEGTIETLFDATKPVYMSTHGSGGNYLSSSNRLVKDGVLAQHDVNYIVLDYSVQANLFYTYAASAVPEVGRLASAFISKLVEAYQLNYGDLTIVGQSLGGQVVGAMGANLGGQIGRIVGLDPAWPLFNNVGPELRLDPTDAVYVQVIHSNGGLQGYKTSTGHVDFYPNGPDMNQPGCGADWFGSCAHDRSTKFFSESIRTGGFTATKCATYENFLAGQCDNNAKSYIGRYELDTTAIGDYFLETAEYSPFSLG